MSDKPPPAPSAVPGDMGRFDLFLSHNSADKHTVEGNAELLLEEAGLRCWVDIWSIPAAADWEAEIMRAVENCRATVVFYGPGGWGPWHSREALLALRHAAAHPEYSVIPVRLSGHTGPVPAPPDDPEGALPRLFGTRQVISLDTDDGDFVERVRSALGSGPPLPWGRSRMTPHVIRRDARRWAAAAGRKRPRHPSRLYRGRQLEDALAVSGEYPGQLDALALEFLRAAAARRRTLAWRWAAGSCAVGVALAVLAYRETLARADATSRLYATLSEGEFNDRRIGASALLAAAAWREAETETARARVLATAAAYSRLRSVLLERGADDLAGGWSAAAVTAGADGERRLFALSTDGMLRLWSLSPGAAAPVCAVLRSGGNHGPVAFMNDGGLAAIWDTRLVVWPRPLEEPDTTRETRDPIWSTAGLVSLPGGRLAAVDGEGALRIINADSPEGGGAPPAPDSPRWTKLAAIPGADAFVLASEEGDVRIHGAGSPAEARARGKLPGEGALDFLTVSPDLKKIVMRRSGGEAILTGLQDGQSTPLGRNAASAHYLADGRLLTGGEDGALTVWPADADPSGSPLMDLLGHHGRVVTTAASGSMAITSDTEVTALLWDLDAHPLRRENRKLDDDKVLRIAWSGDGGTLAALTGAGKCYTWMPFGADPAFSSQEIPADFLHLDDCGGRLLTCGREDGVLSVWKRAGASWSRALTIPTEKEVTAMAVREDLVLLGTKTGELMAWRMAGDGLRPVPGTPFTAHVRDVRSLSFTGNGALLGSGGADGAIKLWDTRRLSEDAKIFGTTRGNGGANFLALSPEGDTYLVGGAVNILGHWRRAAADPVLLAAMRQDSGIGAFTSDRAFEYALTTDMHNNAVSLWHLPSSQKILSLRDIPDSVSAMAYCPARPVVAVGTWGGEVILLDLDPARAAEHLLRLANRNLSPREWTQFLGDTPYRRLNPALPPGEDRRISYD